MTLADGEPDERRRRVTTSWLQLPFAAIGFLAFTAQPFVGAALLLAMAWAWPPPSVGLRSLPVLRVLLAYVVFVIAWVAFAALYLRVVTIEPQELLQRMAQSGTGMEDFWLWAAIAVVCAPIAEEIVFRGYLFTALCLVLPAWAGHLGTAALFGLAHGVEHALPIGALSLLFGYLRARYRSLLPSMLAHAVHNALTVTLVVNAPGLLDMFYDR